MSETAYFWQCSQCDTHFQPPPSHREVKIEGMLDGVLERYGNRSEMCCPKCGTACFVQWDMGTLDLGLVTDDQLEAAYQSDLLR